jgi:hypothetical protein
VFEVHLVPEQSSEDIYRELCNVLNQLKREKPLKGRFLDTELFLNIGPHMNWRAMVGLDQ